MTIMIETGYVNFFIVRMKQMIFRTLKQVVLEISYTGSDTRLFAGLIAAAKA